MKSDPGLRFPRVASVSSPISTPVLLCVVVAVSYLVPKLEGAMTLNPGTVWPLWPGCAILVSILLLVPGKVWPILIPAAFATFALYDLEAGVPIKSIAWFLPANTFQVLTSALGLRYFFPGLPRLNSLKALAKYSLVAVVLAPCGAAFFSANGIAGSYWDGWKACFLSEALAFVTLTPAILSWISEGPAWLKKSRAYHFEAATLIAGLVLLSYFALATPERNDSPALLYSLIPFLLWSALRFGSLGINSAVILVSFLTLWGAVHARGPFSEQGSASAMLSLQLFLVFATMPFMVLAALVEDRKIASRELALSNERVRLAVEAGTSVAWDLAVQSGRNIWTGNLQAIFGIASDPDAPGIEHFLNCVHPDDRRRVSMGLQDARQNRGLYALELRIVRPDGMIRWLTARGKFYYSTEDESERMHGVSLDITERKLAEQALASVNRRLIEALEQERARIARELHDDIVQRLALMAVELEQHRESPPDSQAKITSVMDELWKRTYEMTTDVQYLSHELHSSKLEYLGMAVAMRSFCKEFSEQQNVEVDFKTHDLPSPLSPEISLCLFRVLQEALRNSAKHSGMRRFDVRSWAISEEIHLTVSDYGSGFDRKAARESRGLGLVSMEERLKLLNGTLSIESQPNRGTTVHARVPISSLDLPMRVAG